MQSIETNIKPSSVNLKVDNLIDLHEDLITMLLDFLPPWDLMHLGATNKRFPKILSKNLFIWRKFGPKEKIKDLQSLLLELRELLFFVYEEDGKNEETEEDVEKKLEIEESKKTMLEIMLKKGPPIARYAFRLGVISLEEEENGNKAIKYFEISHNFGFNGASYYMARIYKSGEGGVTMNQQKAEEYYNLSVNLGYYIPNYKLGIECFKSGNYQKALNCFEISANSDYFRANFMLSQMYAYGEGVAVDDEKALEYAMLTESDHAKNAKQYKKNATRKYGKDGIKKYKKDAKEIRELIKMLKKRLKKKEQVEAREQSILPLDASELGKNAVAIPAIPPAAIPTERSITAAKSLKNNDQSLN